MRTLLTLLLILATPICHAQKWVDEKGKVYYGDPPPGVKVRREALKGGATSTVGTPAPGAGRTLSQQEADFQKRNEARLQRERDDRVIANNKAVMKHNVEMMNRAAEIQSGRNPKTGTTR